MNKHRYSWRTYHLCSIMQ